MKKYYTIGGFLSHFLSDSYFILRILDMDIWERYNLLRCGCGQVVRHHLPKVIFVGSNPITRSFYLLNIKEVCCYQSCKLLPYCNYAKIY
jgi:hypothetical protein